MTEAASADVTAADVDNRALTGGLPGITDPPFEARGVTA
jgi:hypothetical protein